MNIGVIGTGYVGLVAGVCFADAGHRVFCVDKDPNKIAQLNENKIPIYEPGLIDVMLRAKPRLTFATDIAVAVDHCDVIFIAVGTPSLPDGSADMTATNAVLDSICELALTKKYVVLKSTVPIGTAARLQKRADEKAKEEIEIINNPEFLKEGAAVEDFLRPDRVVIGCKSVRAEQLMGEIYEPFVRNGNPIQFMDNASAEMTKYAANTFLAIKISFINELANLADKVGADINQVKRGFTSDSRISGAFFHPGVGYGGSCFPKDVSALSKTGEEFGMPMLLANTANEVNLKQKLVLLDKAKEHFPKLSGLKFAVWGLSFKPRTDDVREAPALLLIEHLHKLGNEINGYDPIATKNTSEDCPHFTPFDDAYECVKDADALFVVTEWNEFRSPDFARIKTLMKQAVIFDGRNIYNPEKIKNLGFEYHCIGRETLFHKSEGPDTSPGGVSRTEQLAARS